MPRFNQKSFIFFTETIKTTSISHRSFSSSPAISIASKKLPKFRCINRIRRAYEAKALAEAQKALREYLNATKSVPFVFAELIATNSLFSLATLFPKIRFSTKNFPANFRKILRYEPINEFEFFFESIGVDQAKVHRFLAPKTFFFSQDSTALDAAVELSRFGFPWTMLGKLCSGDTSVLRKSPAELSERLWLMRERYDLDKLALVGIILAFPHLLALEGESHGDSDEIFRCLKKVFVALGTESCVEGNVDVWYELCCKVRFFWDFSCDKTRVVDLMIDNIGIYLSFTIKAMSQKLELFKRFDIRDSEDIAMFILERPELLELDLDTHLVSVLGLLEHFGLGRHEIQSVAQKYRHVLGRNRMSNLPNIMKAMDLHEWCFDKIKGSKAQLLQTYFLNCLDEDDDEAFSEAWKQCSAMRKKNYELLRGFGFGENGKTVKVLKRLCGSGDSLQERFDRLVRLGFKHSDVCIMIERAPDFFCQGPDTLEEKVTFLCHEMGLPMQILVARPKLLHYCFDTRIKRRLEIVTWLRDMGLGAECFSIPYTISLNENKFILRLYKHYPAFLKHYLFR